jgi:hypothetical protein
MDNATPPAICVSVSSSPPPTSPVDAPGYAVVDVASVNRLFSAEGKIATVVGSNFFICSDEPTDRHFFFPFVILLLVGGEGFHYLTYLFFSTYLCFFS